jgi:sugar lactone lactonase YvrE/predicted esterase
MQPESNHADASAKCFIVLRFLPLLALLLASIVFAEASAQTPSTPPKGTVTQSTLPPGRFYPGTPHVYSVYVPAQYDPAKPIAFLVCLDGSGYLREPIGAAGVLDSLIAEHAIPPMIGIFVDPGVLPALSPRVRSRYERSFEYDSLSGRFASFLLEELIPAVAKSYNLSANPDDHAIAGTSTGAVAAFMAAWNCPDEFHRVASFIGTYVAMRGADALLAIVRKTEQKPIRIYLDDGINDHLVPTEPYGTFYAGSWPINNHVMFEDLEFVGYDAKLTIGPGAHDMSQGSARLTHALRWLWRDYPQPIVPHPPAVVGQPGWDPRGNIYSTIFPNEFWQLAGTFSSIHAIAAGLDGNPIVADGDSILRLAADGTPTLVANDSNDPEALTVGPDGAIFVYQQARHAIVAYHNGHPADLASGVEASDMLATAKGTLYFTDPVHRRIGLVRAANTPVTYVPADIAHPSGLALSPDQAMLIVTDAQTRFSWSFQLGPDGSPQNGEPFYRLELPESGWNSDVTGAAEDSIGQIYFATPLGIQVCEANGRVAQILNGPFFKGVSTLRFAGPKLDWMYVTQSGRLYRRHLRVFGVSVATPKIPPQPPL